MNGLPSGDYVFKYIDKDDIERVRQRILERRKFQLLTNVVKNEQFGGQSCASHNKTVDRAIGDAPKTRDLVRIDEENVDEEQAEKEEEEQLDDTPRFVVFNDTYTPQPKKTIKQPQQPKETRLESIETHENMLVRLTSFQQSIDAKLDDVIPAMTSFKYCDGSLDVQKFEKRFSDHLKVFSRNYLYQIECIISEIQQPLTFNEFTAKVYTVYELIFYGLSAFIRNLKHFVGSKVPEKLPKFLSCIRLATNICVQYDYFDEKDSIVVSLLSKVNQILNRFDKMGEIRRKRFDAGKVAPKKSTTGKLSMYGSANKSRKKFKGRNKSKAPFNSNSMQSSDLDGKASVERSWCSIEL